MLRATRVLPHSSLSLKKSFLRSFSSDASATFPLTESFETHLLDSKPPTECVATKEELLKYHKLMYGIRRMEITCDQEYKSRNIRGFCHLSDGQEAVYAGIEDALTRDDDWITTYRCHGVAAVRGNTFQEIFEELFGFSGGVVSGKGGSMHLYNKRSNMYGGAAIVGAQVPVGTGLAFFHKYNNNVLKKEAEKTTSVALAAYGDGSANQGQVWESMNMAALWKLPMIYMCENNMYGMGTSIQRSSSQFEYYKMGQGVIPGLKIDGMDVLACREGMKFAREYASKGNGPIIVEVKTYRYHGHSMSDPGISYRSRDEVTQMRKSKDCIEQTKKRIIDNGFATEEELKAVEKEIRNEVQDALKKAKEGKEMEPFEMLTDIWAKEDSARVGTEGWGDRIPSELPREVRMPDRLKSAFN